jgi:hypothetical protein
MVRGWIVKSLRPAKGERRLVAAMIYQALLDARRGSWEAREWLRTAGPEWCAFIGIDGAKLVTDWPAVPRPEEPVVIRPEPSANAVRCRLRRERQKAAQAQSARPDG